MRLPPLHVIVPDDVARDASFPGTAGRLFAACGRQLALHLRFRETSGADFHRLAETVREAAGTHGGWCVVNERLDVALAVGADAVQVGRRALPLERVLSLAGDRMAVGASVHSVGEALRAAGRGASYLLLGTIFATPSHPGRPGGGPALVEECGSAGAPVVAIGGIDASRVGAVRSAGASAVAVRRAVWETGNPVKAALRLTRELRNGTER